MSALLTAPETDVTTLDSFKITVIRAMGAHPVDLFVGKKIRSRRNELNLSQTELGDALGLTFQQVQKYERGANRVSASKLWEISCILKVDVTYFYSGLGTDDTHCVVDDDELIRLNRAYETISDSALRHAVIVLAEQLSAAQLGKVA